LSWRRGAPALAKTFVHVSNAEDGDIDGYEMNAAGTLTPLGKTKAGKLVMPMAVSLDQKHLYAVLRSQPFTVITYGVDAATGALKQEAAAPLADSMAYASVDNAGRFLFTASYGGDKIAVNPIGANGLIESGPSQVIPTAAAFRFLPSRQRGNGICEPPLRLLFSAWFLSP
jgi:6-phosphogluconolactonase